MKVLSLLEGVFLSLLLLVLLYLHTRGFPLADEGWILQAGKRFANGDVPYKDFQFIYHPGVVYLNALGFKILGEAVLTSRLIAFFNSIFGIGLLYLLAKRLSFSLFSIVSALSLFIFWGAGHVNFVWPVMFCITTGFATVFFWSKYLSDERLQNIFWVGVFLGITLIFKQNFGVAIVLANIVFVLLFVTKEKTKIFTQLAFGFISIGVLQLIYFLSTNSLTWYLHDMRYLLFEKIVLNGSFNSSLPWDYPGPLLYRFVKIILYLFPLIISIFSLYVAWLKANKSVVYFSLLSIFYFALSIRPTTDYVHLTPLIATSGFLLIFLYNQLRGIPRKIGAAFVIFLISAGAFSALFENYYRWDPPLSIQNYFNENNRLLIRSDTTSAYETQEIMEYFSVNAAQEKYLFTYSFASTFNFLSNKVNPTRFDYLHTGVLSAATEQEVKKDLTNKNVRFVLADVPVELENDGIAHYILSNYSLVKTVGNYTIWERK